MHMVVQWKINKYVKFQIILAKYSRKIDKYDDNFLHPVNPEFIKCLIFKVLHMYVNKHNLLRLGGEVNPAI